MTNGATVDKVGWKQGSTKLLSLLSEIIETPKSGRNFSLETTRKQLKQVDYSWQSCLCDRKLFLWQKQVSVKEKSFCQRGKFLSKREVYVWKNKFLSKKEVFIIPIIEIRRFRSFWREFWK